MLDFDLLLAHDVVQYFVDVEAETLGYQSSHLV